MKGHPLRRGKAVSWMAFVLAGCPSPPPSFTWTAEEGSTLDASTSTGTTTSTGREPSVDGDSITESSSNDASGNVSDVQPSGCGDAPGFHVEDGRLHDGNCNPFVLRGINYPYVWYRDSKNTAAELAEIAGLGANAVRVVLGNGQLWPRVLGDEVREIVGWAKQNRLVAVLEIHDATGWSEQTDAANPNTAVEYWLSDEIRTAIDGQEAYVLINIANEPFGNDQTAQWVPFHTGAIAALREAGIAHTLIVDAPNWGQDWTHTMLDGRSAKEIWDSDPDENVVFSVHMYDVYGDDATVTSYLDAFAQSNLPLIVGGFAADHGPGAPVAVQAIMSRAQALGVGYLGWLWSGSAAGLTSMDIAVGFDGENLSPWGRLLIHGDDGIVETSRLCTVYAE